MQEIKEQRKTPEKELNKMEASKQLNTESKTIVIRMLKELGDNFNKEIESIKKMTCKHQKVEIKNTISKMKNALEGINDRT